MQSVRYLLRLNAATCAGFGALFVAWAADIALFLGAMPAALLQWIGAALLLHSAHLLLVSTRQRIRDLEIYYFSSGDLLWFVASLWLVIASGMVTTTAGATVTLCVALGVAGIGIAQLWMHAKAKGLAGHALGE